MTNQSQRYARHATFALLILSKALIEASERIAKEANLVDFHAANQTILHTEFVRQRVKPGQV